MPHNPLSIVRMITHKREPLQRISNTAKEKTRTITVCTIITTNCVTTCEKRISGGVTPVNKISLSYTDCMFMLLPELHDYTRIIFYYKQEVQYHRIYSGFFRMFDLIMLSISNII